MEPQVCLLTKEQVAQFWGQIEWRIDATPQLRRFFTKEDIVDQVCKDHMQIWTAGSDLVLLTQIINPPLGAVLQIVWAHGNGLGEHFVELKEKFHMFAWMHQCKKIEILGRPGWERKLRQQEGFEIEYVAYSADVIKPRMH